MKKLKVGVIGLGFAGTLHLDAIRRIPNAELVAVAGTDQERTRQMAEEYGIEKYYGNIDDMLAGGDLDVVHNCTRNDRHKEINLKVIQSGTHLFAEKPLTRTVAEAEEVMAALCAHPQVVTGVNHCYRMNPMVQEIRTRIANGEIGAPMLVHGSYLQDHLLNDTDYSWRIDPEINGPSRVVADIGTHWMDLIQHVLASRITEVCADLVTVLPVRRKPRREVSTFSRNDGGEFDEIQIVNEDFGSVLFKMENGVHGVFYVSQVSAGHGCYLNFEINGRKASVSWNQEEPNHAWIGRKDAPCQLLDRNPAAQVGAGYARLAKGHPEGWNDAQRNNIESFYRYISDRSAPRDFATFDEAFYQLRLVEAILESSRIRAWVKI